MKMKILKCLTIVLAMACIFCFPVSVSATSQGTDGTELEVIQPQNLEIQLGESWAGVEFELKTDAGIYPGMISVGADGVLRLEIGGSEYYILTCMNSSVEIPEPSDTIPEEKVTGPGDESFTEASEDADATVDSSEGTAADETAPADAAAQGTVAGIPVTHIVLFGGGLIVAIGTLIGIQVYQKKRENTRPEDDENDEI